MGPGGDRAAERDVHVWTTRDGLGSLWDLEAAGTMFTDLATAREAVRDVLALAVHRRLMADVGVGVFLSGGLDSSVIATVAARQMRAEGRRPRSFAVGTEGSPDLVAARVVAEHLDLDHAERIYEPTRPSATWRTWSSRSSRSSRRSCAPRCRTTSLRSVPRGT